METNQIEQNNTNDNIDQHDDNFDQNDQSLNQEDLENMSDEDFIKNFDKIVSGSNNTDSNVQDSTKDEPQQELEQENSSDNNDPQAQDGGSQSEVNDFTPPFDKELFDKLPEDYQKLFRPIKANKTEIQPTPEEMIKLIQLGSKYYSDRQYIKPKLEIVKKIEKAGLDDESKLITLLEAAQGNKEAISQIIKDNNISLDDVSDLIEDENFKYSPDKNKYDVSRELTLEEINNQLKDSPTYQKTVEVLSSFDDVSKQELIGDPQKILALNKHIEIGLYDEVVKEIEKGKIFGNYLNIPFIRAYEDVAIKLLQQKENQQQHVQQQPQQQQIQQQNRIEPQLNPPVQIMPRNEFNTGGSKRVVDLTKIDVDKMPDEDFEKMFKRQFGI